MSKFYIEWMTTSENPAPESREQIGRRLVLTRDALGLTQKELAARLDISATRLEGYESGRNLLKPEVAILVIRALPEAKVDFNWLYHGDMSGLAHGVAEQIKVALKASEAAA